MPTINQLIAFLESLPEDAKKKNLSVCNGDEVWSVTGYFKVGSETHIFDECCQGVLDDGQVVLAFGEMLAD